MCLIRGSFQILLCFEWLLDFYTLPYRMLEDFGNEIEGTDAKMDATMKKVAKIMHMTNGNL